MSMHKHAAFVSVVEGHVQGLQKLLERMVVDPEVRNELWGLLDAFDNRVEAVNDEDLTDDVDPLWIRRGHEDIPEAVDLLVRIQYPGESEPRRQLAWWVWSAFTDEGYIFCDPQDENQESIEKKGALVTHYYELPWTHTEG